MKILRKFNECGHWLMDNLSWIAMAALSLVVLFQVVNRNTVAIGAIWTEEVARYLFVWTIMTASVCAVYRLEHITVTTIFQLWPCLVTDVIKVVGDCFTVAFYAFFTYATAVWTMNSTKILTEITQIPIWIVYCILPICGVFMFTMQVEHLIDHIKAVGERKKGDQA